MKKKMNPKFLPAVIMSAVLAMQGQAAMAAEFSDGSSFGYTESYSPFSSSDHEVWQEQAPAAAETPAAQMIEEAVPEEAAVFSEITEETPEETDVEEFTEEEPAAEEETPAEEAPVTEEVPVMEETLEEAEIADTEEFQQEAYKTEFVYEDAEVLVNAKALEEAQIPFNTEMEVVKLLEGTTEFEAAKSAAEASLGVDETAEYVFYDVTFEVDGQEIMPAEGMVSIQIEFKTIQKDENADGQSVIHIDETEAGYVVKDVTASIEAGNNMSSVNFAF